ncbi:hypothetical protein [Octadecabacter antarcticus]|nr:hypothetical protein [Octadecabacter antarcticus]
MPAALIAQRSFDNFKTRLTQMGDLLRIRRFDGADTFAFLD